jgi:hypothetical protein
MMTNGPAATIGRIFDVPFPRPRRRDSLLDRPDYFWLRDAVLGFLEEETVDGHGPSRSTSIDGHGPSRSTSIDGHGPSRSTSHAIP